MDGSSEHSRNAPRDDSSSIHPKLRGKRRATDDVAGMIYLARFSTVRI